MSRSAIERRSELLEDDLQVKVAGVDIDGVLRGKIMSKKKFLSVLDDGFGFCSVVFGWDLHDRPYVEKTSIASTETGYGDVLARVDLNSFRRIPWENNIALFLVEFLEPDTRRPLSACPRGLLRSILGELQQLGLEAMCGSEFEFFHFQETPRTLVEKEHQKLAPMTPGMFGYSLLRPSLQQDYYYALINECRQFGIPLEALHTETGPGVYEAALEYTGALEAADRAQLFKTAVKQIGLRHGVIASFMAKPYVDQPGCSGHMHISLRDIATGKSAFAGDENASAFGATSGMSEVMQWFVAGMLKGLPSVLAILAPNVNSYKRLVANYWAPIAVSWGRENRTAAIRVITPPSCSRESTRLEMRVTGADINVHLALAACLGCGLYGVRHQIALPPPVTGSAEAGDEHPRLARDLRDATAILTEPESIARQVLGSAFVDHYAATRRHEWALWADSVTDWELKRYLELA
ncbi:hypothetical protein THASP1DRAFT_34178 [Thamnocephalis sphaerospora]|uniref:Glutamine synthetase n=1 Tax=Thamnocephalis sphaerospora TaxID=78915 RepID=A0A4P9XVE4_9FUNG|nr:hypothetical protein THASP1DRAFT_34178 [Thamnocephalis sphaerospora]|eukprot:RKP10254.1 hypothetical protein THASP1DRAFT_34178 [Thamnocephalis sphaerospora]